MPYFTMIPGLVLVLERDCLGSPDVAFRSGYHFRSLDQRFACGDFVAVANKQHSIKLDGYAIDCIEKIYFDYLARRYPVLLAASFYYRVNVGPPKQKLYQSAEPDVNFRERKRSGAFFVSERRNHVYNSSSLLWLWQQARAACACLRVIKNQMLIDMWHPEE